MMAQPSASPHRSSNHAGRHCPRAPCCSAAIFARRWSSSLPRAARLHAAPSAPAPGCLPAPVDARLRRAAFASRTRRALPPASPHAGLGPAPRCRAGSSTPRPPPRGRMPHSCWLRPAAACPTPAGFTHGRQFCSAYGRSRAPVPRSRRPVPGPRSRLRHPMPACLHRRLLRSRRLLCPRRSPPRPPAPPAAHAGCHPSHLLHPSPVPAAAPAGCSMRR